MTTTPYESNTFDSANYGLAKSFIEWWDEAICRTTPAGQAVDWFSNNARQIHEAKKVCADCGVRKECLQYAIDNDLTHFVLGGLSADERRAL